MWFKQIQYFHLKTSLPYQADYLSQALANLAFEPCLPSLPLGMGFIPPLQNNDEEEAPLVHAANGYMMLCLQVEEKILPSTVVRQALQERIKIIEQTQKRKVPYKEKQALQSDIISTLLPRAFSRFKQIYAYIDTKRDCLILNTVHPKEVGYFLNSWKKVLPDHGLFLPELKDLNYVLTHWVQHHSYPQSFEIDKACVLQDPSQQSRTIRCQQQNLSATPIQSLLTDGCQVKQLALTWQERVSFTINSEFMIRSLDFQDKLQSSDAGDAQTEQQQFDVDFILMTQAVAELMTDLIAVLSKSQALQEQGEAIQV
ncbi:MAG: recombination-associated protein RdgC [Gammaproteobacteria bacterium]|jgi:recombination associated protein RdgC